MAELRYSIVVPHFNHQVQLVKSLPELVETGLSIVIVDDGSDEESYRCLSQACAAYPDVKLFRLDKNQGKGAAVAFAAGKVREMGFTHMLQIDADGQHEVKCVPEILAESRRNPDWLVSGLPEYANDVPVSRLYGRKISLWWVRIETLTTSIKDVMCGFRVYPLDPFLTVWRQTVLGSRMQFDIEIMVRMYWAGTQVGFVPVRVSYPESGLSHFRLFKDNVSISLMHAKLFFGMLPRAPKLMLRTLRNRKSGQISKTESK